MTPTIWIIILLAALIYEFVRMELVGACVSIGAIGAVIAYAFSLNIWIQAGIFIVVTMLLIVVARPIGMKYVARVKKEGSMLSLVGETGVVMCDIDNEAGVGIALINGKQWAARSNRANTIIREGEVVTVVNVKGNVAIVNIKR